MNTLITCPRTEPLCNRANDISDMQLNADEAELAYNGEAWTQEYNEHLKESYDTLKACDVTLVLFSTPNSEGYESTHIHGSPTNEEILSFIELEHDNVTIHHIAR